MKFDIEPVNSGVKIICTHGFIFWYYDCKILATLIEGYFVRCLYRKNGIKTSYVKINK